MSRIREANPPAAQALSEGTLGVALLYIERGDLTAAHALVVEAVDAGVSIGANASLFHGAPALEFVLGRVGRADHGLRRAVEQVVAIRLAAAVRRRTAALAPPSAEFDLIRGLTGLGALLLARPKASSLLEDVLTYLVSLTRSVADSTLPGWWSLEPPERGVVITGGHGNNGVAHGVAGPLALLSLAARHGVQVEGQVDAIEVFARWLERYGGYYWITRDQLSRTEPKRPGAGTGRPSWCYGDLGIARALQLAGIATDDPVRVQAAEDAAVAALSDPARTDRITDASLCHGWAGLLTVTRAMAAESHRPERFTAHIEHLTACLAAGIDVLPKPGFLEGNAGARLALEGMDTTGWTRALLIT